MNNKYNMVLKKITKEILLNLDYESYKELVANSLGLTIERADSWIRNNPLSLNNPFHEKHQESFNEGKPSFLVFPELIPDDQLDQEFVDYISGDDKNV